MRWVILGPVLLGATVGGVVQSARAEVTAEQVRVAIDRAKAYLERQQQPEGYWPEHPLFRGGISGLCTLALLDAGMEPEDDCIRRALGYLRTIEPEKTYVVALQTMVFCRATPDRDRAIIDRNVRWLEKTQLHSGPSQGAWSYPGMAFNGDPSNSQFAVLALYEAERIGVKVDGQTWSRAKAYWDKTQNPDGSWGYALDAAVRPPGTGSMTCAGIACLVIANDRVGQANARADGDNIRCCQASQSDDGRIRRALNWLGRDDRFAVTHNPGEPRAYWLYYLYALERVGRLTAQRFIGRHDWYREGADHLLRVKGGETSDRWQGVGAVEENPLIATSFALLFLSKGRWPVLLSKLKHGPDDDWNQHASDVNNLTRYVESRAAEDRTWPRDLTWQVIDLEAATVEDLLESPVLYYCGSKSPMPEAAAAQEKLARKLRDYLDRGGFLFAEAYCGGTGFDQGFRKLIDERVFPEPEYRLVPLPPEHAVWRTEERVDAQYVRQLWGVEFGCRTSVVYCPPDAQGHVRPSLSCLWELSRLGRDQKLSPAVQAQVDAGLSIGINVLAYATNRELKFKDPARIELAGTSPGAFPRGRIYVASLRHPGGCNAAPRALATLLETAQRERKIRTAVEHREVSLTDDALFDYHLVFMHGRTRFHLTDAERKQLRAYIERGGMLFANSICASRQFSASFRREMEVIFPDRPLKRIPKDDPLLTKAYDGFDLSTVTRRDPQGTSGNEPLKDVLRKVAPELEGIKFDDRYRVIFSPYDLSCALEKHDSLECQGYVREDAARIGLNVLLYSLQ